MSMFVFLNSTLQVLQIISLLNNIARKQQKISLWTQHRS